ncbi:mechanosensitive ion channel family protein [Massilia sp. GCM10020059]|uniref:Mechanosensitive ion channel family protein n=1 Tax=Massilia agrisoli TaxID=2892444 RepID=A0ABS8IUM8_9BURK|nr:mechanosensitive ion channel family protein [Massilia agrisoli]MCC6071888.1 mechanosensitive ion channel family protein [Massilia agrisoli]
MNDVFYGNTISDWIVAAGIAAAVALTLYALRYFIKCRLGKLAQHTETKIDDILLEVLGSTYFVFILLAALYIGSLSLALPAKTALILSRLAVAGFLFQAAMWGDAGIRAWRNHSQDKHGLLGNHGGVSSVGTLFFMARMVLWVVVALMVLDNLGVNITTLVASLGVGGIAVALAVQNVLGDLFASLSIVLDKPFVVGDTIIVGDAQGTVEYIGVKTTRLRSLSGEQIVFSNAELLKSRIHNQQRMVSRRATFSIGVTYDTTREQLQSIPGMLKAIVEAEPNATFDRAHFARFGASSLDFDVVYHIKTADYMVFMDTQQSIFLKVFEQFGAAGIDFAYPTSVVKLEAGGAGEPDVDQPSASRRAPYQVIKPR